MHYSSQLYPFACGGCFCATSCAICLCLALCWYSHYTQLVLIGSCYRIQSFLMRMFELWFCRCIRAVDLISKLLYLDCRGFCFFFLSMLFYFWLIKDIVLRTFCSVNDSCTTVFSCFRKLILKTKGNHQTTQKSLSPRLKYSHKNVHLKLALHWFGKL